MGTRPAKFQSDVMAVFMTDPDREWCHGDIADVGGEHLRRTHARKVLQMLVVKHFLTSREETHEERNGKCGRARVLYKVTDRGMDEFARDAMANAEWMPHCTNCGRAIEKYADTGDFHHTDSGMWCGGYTSQMATPFKGMKYTVLMHDGLTPSSGVPEYPSARNQAASIEDAKILFKTWLRDSGNDYTRAAGYESPYAEVILTRSWDGISYGDYPWVCLLKRGNLGGAVIEKV
jgi:hypothetical protein